MPTILRSGSRGAEVRALQHALNARPYIRLAEDGIFGPKTAAAVREFQRRVRLMQDGIVGPKTHSMLWTRVVDSAMALRVPVEPSPLRVGAGPGGSIRQAVSPPPPPSAPLPPAPSAGVVQQISAGGNVTLTPWTAQQPSSPMPPPTWAGVVSYALVYRTASSGPHLELALNPQLSVNSRVQSTDPRWGLQVNGQVTFADLIAPGRWHLLSPFFQVSAGLGFDPGVTPSAGGAFGLQAGFDLLPDRLQVQVQGSVGGLWTNLGSRDATFSLPVAGMVGGVFQF